MAHLKYYKEERIVHSDAFDKKLPTYDAVELVLRKLERHYKLGKLDHYETSGRRHSCANAGQVTINMDDATFGTVAHEIAHVIDHQKRRKKAIFLSGEERREILGKRWHGRRHDSIIRRVLAYCQRKNFWNDEIVNKQGYVSASKRYGIICKLCKKEVHSTDNWRHAQSYLKYFNRDQPLSYSHEHKGQFELADRYVPPIPKPRRPEPTKEELQAKKVLGVEQRIKRYRIKLKLYANKLKKAERSLKRLNSMMIPKVQVQGVQAEVVIVRN